MTSVLPERDERTFTVETSSKAYTIPAGRPASPVCDVCDRPATHRVMLHIRLASGKAIASLSLCPGCAAKEGWS